MRSMHTMMRPIQGLLFAWLVPCVLPSGFTLAASSADTLVCSGPWLAGIHVNIPFQPNANPAPSVGAVCARAGTRKPTGTAIVGSAITSETFAVVLEPAGAARGHSTAASAAGYQCAFSSGPLKGKTLNPSSTALAGPQGAPCDDNYGSTGSQVAAAASTAGGSGRGGNMLVCFGQWPMAGFRFGIPFAAAANPAPTLGVACTQSGTTAPTGKAVMGIPAEIGLYAVVTGPANGLGNGSGEAVGTLVSQRRQGGLTTCTYQGGAGTFDFQTNLTTCPPTRPSPKASGPGASGASGTAGASQGTLVCSGPWLVPGVPFNIPFAAGLNPAPTSGATCARSGVAKPTGTALVGVAVPTSLRAVVIAAPSRAGSGAAGAGSGGSAASPGTGGVAVLVSSQLVGLQLTCTYREGTKTFTRHTARAECPQTVTVTN